ncbi:MAG: hypothetical protein EON58_07560 [Alphaproteobacteria bacterium]|nr:MAG: hypothetical protein EON58_07560 [Alphaproteobacteria bacterium]
MNNFVLSYHPFTVNPSAGQVLNHVKINRHIAQYYAPFPGTYLLKSASTAYELNDSLKGFFEVGSYLLIRFESYWASGQLPQDIWNWINSGSIPLPPPVTPSPPPTIWPQGSLGQALAEWGKSKP